MKVYKNGQIARLVDTAAKTIALMISDTPTSIIIPDQNTNHLDISVSHGNLILSIRNVRVRKPVPNQKTMFDMVSAFLLQGETAKNLSAKMTIWKSAQTKLNRSTAKKTTE